MDMLSPGVAIGVLFCADSSMTEVPVVYVEDTGVETERLYNAVEEVKKNLLTAKAGFTKQKLKNEAEILDAHIMIAGDENLLSETATYIKNEKVCAAYAYQRKMTEVAESLLAERNEYMRGRASDIFDVTRQVIANLLGTAQIISGKTEDHIIYSYELTPSIMGQQDVKQLKGVLTEIGGASSHTAIMARALGIPAITGYKPAGKYKTGDRVVIDAFKKEVYLNPSSEIVADFRQREKKWLDELCRDTQEGQGTAVTLDNIKVPVYANVGNISTAESALLHGAEGVGLLRTEFLYMDSLREPSEDEQIALLSGVLRLFPDKPVTVRTLDIGGDKHIPWLPMRRSHNPLTDIRGVQFYIQEPEFFRTQIRAVLRAGNGFDIKIMIPMVSAPEEIIFVKKTIEDIHNKLLVSGTPHIWPVEFGIMLETPAAVMNASELADMVDFFSIGTNDLGRYIMAKKHTGKEIPDYIHSVLLRFIRLAVESAHKKEIKVSVCGEIAGDPLAVKTLLAAGVDCLSMNANSIGKVKKMIRDFSVSSSKQIFN
ncbi:MAG: phosphoenolpyruvate--protein phosphotransferase [Deferribacteraceae bacterium]|nr:phosphoenolpyruvate--protein phosphotransferase [Deferribacteraceae bacterium]